MNRTSIIGIVLAAMLWAHAALAQETGAMGTAGAPFNAPSLWFPVGEVLAYRIYWAGIPVGQARIGTEWIQKDGHSLLAIRYRSKTNRFFDAIYPVDDSGETIVEPSTFLPTRFSMKLIRRHTEHDETVSFDHPNRVAFMTNSLSGEARSIKIDSDTRDIMSFMFHLRAKKMAPRQERHYWFMGDDGHIVPMGLKTHDIESVKVPEFGTVSSLKIEPRANFAGLLIEKGRVMAWISDDDRRLCTRMSVKAPLASVNIILCAVEGPGDDFWSQAMRRMKEKTPCQEKDISSLNEEE